MGGGLLSLKKDRPAPANLLDLKPRRAVGWETAETGRVVVLMPRFTWGPLARYVMPRLRNPHVRVKLDAHGSFLWQQCDGETPVLAIAERMASAFGDELEPMLERVGAFLRRLQREELIQV